MSDVAEQLAGQVSEAAEAVAEAVLPETPFVARGLRLDWAAKRGLDIGVAATALFLLLPLMLLIAGLVWAGDRKAPIFRHARLGRDGRSFGCLKFRSMVTDGEAVLAAHLAASPRAQSSPRGYAGRRNPAGTFTAASPFQRTERGWIRSAPETPGSLVRGAAT
ncbi:sugar transferase, partial [Methylobacterium sp. J-048]|uniref:sugar transferase n=1 Tax=Methylobacterium sp. J-048 TaxID=2836635 RepID=UPI001FBAC22E